MDGVDEFSYRFIGYRFYDDLHVRGYRPFNPSTKFKRAGIQDVIDVAPSP
jgi:hypothetical protein